MRVRNVSEKQHYEIRSASDEIHFQTVGSASPVVLYGGIVALSLTFAQAAHAYIGPGLGLSQIGIALSAVGVLLFFLSTAIWYPFKRMLRRRRAKRVAASRHDGEPHADTGVEDSPS